MSDVRVVGVVTLPGPHEARWRSALVQAAKAKGWAATKDGGDRDVSAAGQLIFMRDIDDARLAETDALVVVSASPDEVFEAARQRHSDDPRQALRRAASQFSAACRLIENHAVVIDGAASEADLPGLGRVASGAEEVRAAVALDPANPLAIYGALPPRIGATAAWSPDLFSYTRGVEHEGGTADIDISGRARILVHGPYFQLPPGAWRVTARFTVEPDDDAFLMFQWGAAAGVTTCYGAFDTPGVYEVVLDRVWERPGNAELRVWAERGHLFGKMTWLGCHVERLPDDAVIAASPI
ncbi:hypothetical protein [Brevundimonas sp.]|uniref:hypothetical protein n=1 Tax=Brevundimonas sp. TaxID=1871086 RepID=UPI003D6CD0FD